MSTNIATASLETSYTANAVIAAAAASNAAAANAAAASTLAAAQADPVATVVQATHAVADAQAAVTAANAAVASVASETTDAATLLSSANAVQTAAGTASNLSPAALTLAGTQVTTSNTAASLASTDATTAANSVTAANAALVAANAALVTATEASVHTYLYSDGGLLNNTFTNAPIANGGGSGTLNINSSIVAAMTMGYGGQDWNVLDNGYINLNITNSLGSGAINLVSSTAFNDTFNMGNLNLITSISAEAASGSTTITLDGSIAGSTAYAGTVTIIATNDGLGNAGAIDILAGSGATIVSNVLTTTGEESAGGAGLVSVTMTSHGAGAQNVGTTGASDTALATIYLTQDGAGAQTIISTDTAAVSVTAVMGLNSTAGAQTITTNSGNDLITLIDNGGFTGSIVTINAKGGVNQISLAATHTGVDTIINNTGIWIVGSDQTTAIDTIINFVGGSDVIQLSQSAYGGNFFGAIGAGNTGVVLDSHIGVLANTTTIVNSNAFSFASGIITPSISGALVLVGINAVGNTLDIYAVNSTANPGDTILQDLAAHTATLVGHVSVIGQPLTAVDFVIIA